MVEFIFDYLDASAQLIDPSQNVADATLSDVSATVTVSAGDHLTALNTLFLFSTDSNDVDDVTESDISYAVLGNSWPLIRISQATVTDSPILSGDGIDNKLQFDVVRAMAQEVFGEVGGAAVSTDLFNNEDDLVADVSDADVSIQTSIKGLLASSGTTSVPLDEEDTGTNNIVKSLLGQLQNDETARARFTGAEGGMLHVNNKSGEYFQFLFTSADKIHFRVTYNPSDATPFGDAHGTIQPRTYKVVLDLST